MEINQIMSRKVVTVDIDDDLYAIKHIFDHVDFHHLIVISQHKPVGIISDKNLAQALSPYVGTASENTRDLNLLNKRAHQIMARPLQTITPNQNVAHAISIFNKYNCDCLAVVENQKLVGILSWRDIFQHIEQLYLKKVNQTD